MQCFWIWYATSSKPLNQHFIRISKSLRMECSIWIYFLQDWNGRSLFLAREPIIYDEEFSTDAAGSLGFGGYIKNSQGLVAWFSKTWDKVQLTSWHMHSKELYPILIKRSHETKPKPCYTWFCRISKGRSCQHRSFAV